MPMPPGGRSNGRTCLRNNCDDLGEQGMWAMHNWIRESLRTNKPFDQFVRELITARGSIYTNGPANYYRIHKDSSMLAEATAQLFLGVRLECAKCHHHPFEKYSQDDYYGLAAFFARTGTKNSEEFGLFGREQVGDRARQRRCAASADEPGAEPQAAGWRRRRPSARPPHAAGRLADGEGQRAISPGASSIATWATCSAAAWSSRSMTCARRTRRRIRR